MPLVYCVGTATEVGKTWVGAAVLAELRAGGRSVAARKAVQSFDPADGTPLDSEVLAEATGQRPEAVCGADRTYEVAMAPPMAADVLGRACPTIDEVVVELRWPEPEPDVRWVEGVGGPRSPLAADGDGVDLARALEPDVVVLVADAGLGTINAVQLAVAPFAELGHRPIVVLNRYDAADDLHRRNHRWLADRAGLMTITSAVALATAI